MRFGVRTLAKVVKLEPHVRGAFVTVHYRFWEPVLRCHVFGECELPGVGVALATGDRVPILFLPQHLAASLPRSLGVHAHGGGTVSALDWRRPKQDSTERR